MRKGIYRERKRHVRSCHLKGNGECRGGVGESKGKCKKDGGDGEKNDI